MLRKYWFSVSDAEQERRFQDRLDDPMRRWKLSPMDLESVTRWEDYSRAKDEMFFHTDTASAPWAVVEAEDKRRARLNMIAHLLSSVPFKHVDAPKLTVCRPARRSAGYQRPPPGTCSPRCPTTPPRCTRGTDRAGLTGPTPRLTLCG